MSLAKIFLVSSLYPSVQQINSLDLYELQQLQLPPFLLPIIAFQTVLVTLDS